MSAQLRHSRVHALGKRLKLAVPVAVGALAFAALPVGQADAASAALRAGNVTVTERDGAGLVAKVPVKLSHPKSRKVTVDYRTVQRSAKSPTDYRRTTGTLVFKPGVTRKVIKVPIVGDVAKEPTEAFSVRIFDATRAVIADPVALVTIQDDADACTAVSNGVPPSLRIRNDVSRIEGWTTKLYKFEVELSEPSASKVCVYWSTAAGTATSPSDFTASSGTLVFLPGDTFGMIAVPVHGDITAEGDEAFRVQLSTPVNALLTDAVGAGTILNDDCRDSDEGVGAATGLGMILGDASSNPLTTSSNICQADADWYRFTIREYGPVEETKDLTARIALAVGDSPDQTVGDLDLRVYRADGSLVGLSDNEGTADEQIVVKKKDTGPADDDTVVYVKVYGVAGNQVNNYNLTVIGNVTSSIPPNL